MESVKEILTDPRVSKYRLLLKSREKELAIAKMETSILRREVTKLEIDARKHFTPEEQKWYDFSLILEMAQPIIFEEWCYASDSDGNDLEMPAFQSDRIARAEEEAQDVRYGVLFEQFMIDNAYKFAVESHKQAARVHSTLPLATLGDIGRAAAALARVRGLATI